MSAERDATPSAAPVVSEIRIRIAPGHDNLVGWVSFVLNGAFCVNNVALRRAPDGRLYVTYPNRESRSGAKQPYFAPINRQVADVIESALVGAFIDLNCATPTTDPKGDSPCV